MKFTRRKVLGGAAIGAGMLAFPAILRAQTKTLKLSHQFPGGTIETGDFRDRLCRKFADQVAKRTNGAVKVDVYPGQSLMKTMAQYRSVHKGALDMTLIPIGYAGGEFHETNIGLMPCLPNSYEQAVKWKTAPIGQTFAKILEEKNVLILSWVWQSGAIASRGNAVLVPDDVKGLKIRGGSREMDLMLAAAGGTISTMPSSEMYIGMQTGALDAAVSSSTSHISFHLNELSKNLTSGQGKSFWFALEPLLIAKSTLTALTPDQQKILRDVGTEMETFGLQAARADDEECAKVFAAKGAKVHEMTEDQLKKWVDIASATSWKDYAAKSAKAAELLKLAQAVS